ncbi:unnamed protein product [Echinostoma caproni]|uniref:Nuclear pore complex protein Nup85 n=1 Tax=Echinostoma caproni TaxID=27848 RepID=A0A183AZ74_9TREM|nr:unnamed protein product [Echinostoma caproni]
MFLYTKTDIVYNPSEYRPPPHILQFQAFPSGHLAYSLCSWFYIQSQEAADNARVLIEEYGSKSHSRPEQDERFWPTILTLVLQARPHEAAGLLSIHSHANSRILRSLRQILAWSYWQSECTRLLASGEFAPVGGDDTETADHVQLIASVLCGHAASWDDPRLIEATGGPNTWYFRFVSFLFYTDQMMSIDGIGYHLDQWFARPTNSTLLDSKTPLDQAIDELIISVFRLNLQQFIHTAGEKLSSRWLVAHFTHLLHRVYPDMLYSSENRENNQMGTERSHTKMEDTDTDTGHHGADSSNSPIRSTFPLADSFLIGYAESLASDPSMLYLALGYMDHCDSGRARQSALLLAHGVPTSTRAVNWVGDCRAQ